MVTNKYKLKTTKESMNRIKLLKQDISDDYWDYGVNHPETFAIVVKGYKTPIYLGDTKMTFMSKALAERWMNEKLERIFVDQDLEVIQLRRTNTEKTNIAKKYEIEKDLRNKKEWKVK